MALYTYIVLVLFLDHTLAKNCVTDNTPEYITWEKELLKDLKCGYMRHDAPREASKINVTFFVKVFHFDDEEGVLTVQAFMKTKWKDERLNWDPEKYHGIKETDDPGFFIWTPSFGILNSEDFLDSDVTFFRFNLKSTGVVNCQHQTKQQTWCNVKLTNWPYDTQECSFVFSSRKTENYTLDLDVIVLESEGSNWYMFDFEQDNSTGLTKVTFFLMREGVGLSAIVIFPAFVLTVLSILSLFLDVRRKVRLAIICFSVMGHYYFLTELAADLPKQTHFPPTLLSYYRGSLVLSVIIILLTFFLAAICKFKPTSHNCVKLINDFVYDNNYLTYLVYPRWDFDDATVDSKSSSEDWVKLANIVNSVSIFCVVFAYIGMYATDIPKRIDYLQ